MASRTTSSPNNLFGLDREGLSLALSAYDAPAYHATQIYQWLYARRSYDPELWTDLPKALRRSLAADAAVNPGSLAERVVASDGTVKYRTELARGGSVESVYMEQSGRVTLCLSSQVGCALDCDFCLTGKMGFVRHLDAGEIAGQLALILDDKALGDRAVNIVFMGMGEPLHNLDAVLAAFRLMTDPKGFGLSRRRITVSTSGMVPAIEKLALEPRGPRLAVSLNATTDAVRDRIMPINRKYPLARLLAACRSYRETTGDDLTFEYVLLAGVNDTIEDVRRLGSIARRMRTKINLIPFNEVPELLQYRAPSRARVVEIRDELLAAGARASIRWSRGADARAACGQLALTPQHARAAGASGREKGNP